MRNECMTMDVHKDTLSHRLAHWYFPLRRHGGHLIVSWDVYTIRFTCTELHKMHVYFLHLSSSKLYNLIRVSIFDTVTAQMLWMFEKIDKSDKICAEHEIPRLFSQSNMLTEALSFHQDLLMDVMYIYRHTILHCMDIATVFGNAPILSGASDEAVWASFECIWATVSPNNLNEFHAYICRLGFGEIYHTPLSRIFNKL